MNFDQFLSLFLVCDYFVSLFVTKLGASIMTRFSSGKPALPLSPFLVVKFDHYLRCEMLINFWSFFTVFCVHLSDFSEKLDFAIKNRQFCHFFVSNFDQFFIIFVTFLGSFLGF